MQNIEWFINPVKNQYADFEGVATRQQFWMFTLWYIIVNIIIAIIAGVLDLDILLMFLYLGVIVPSLAIGARRLHDINKSGWWQLIILIPIVGFIILIILFALESVVEGNKYKPAVAAPINPVPVPPAPLSSSNDPQ